MVDDALGKLGADRAEMAAARRRTGRIFLPWACFANVVALLGLPLKSETIEAPPSDSNLSPLTRLTYQLPLWPDLVFYMQGISELPIPDELGFARPSHAECAVPDGREDLHPWAWLYDEVVGRFGPPIDQRRQSWFP
jgi:hypothetical protein